MSSLEIAPHEGRELEFVTIGVKPLCSISVHKQPIQYEAAIALRNVVDVVDHNNGLITVTQKKNRELHDVYKVLTSSKANMLVKSKEEKHRLLGRLFGYTEKQIDDFIAAGLDCACGECRWVDGE